VRAVALHAALLATAASWALPAAAWSPASQETVAVEAAKMAPPDLARQLERRRDVFLEGVRSAFLEDAERHFKNSDGTGTLDRTIFLESDAAVKAIRDLGPFDEVVRQLGVVAHYVADLNNPLNTSGTDGDEARYFADYLRYVQQVEPRFALVFYTTEPVVESRSELKTLIGRALYRGRALYPLIGAEYRRIGFASGIGRFDDRSTAFGAAAVAFSHAVSDVARVLRYIWLAGGGIDERTRLWAEKDRLLLLHRDRAAR